MKRALVLSVLILPLIVGAQQGVTEEEAKKANNPLANAKAFNLQNYYVPSIYEDASLKANSLLIRYASPFAGGKVLVRVTQPLSTNPSGYGPDGKPTYSTGLGDLNFFATYTLTKPDSKLLMGVGPQVVIPTAGTDYLGSGKWQLGAAFVLFDAASPAVQYGGLVTWQASVAGQSDRANTNLLIIQPFLIFQLGKGLYLRNTALWNFNLQASTYNVPLGVGVGQVLKAGKVVCNLFLEPQYTFLHGGKGQPAMQLFSGLNFQF
jgi:hypothetical protein